jgi:hypothetical protein
MRTTPTIGPRGDAAAKLGYQIGIDTAADIVNEFLPDLERRPRRRKK